MKSLVYWGGLGGGGCSGEEPIVFGVQLGDNGSMFLRKNRKRFDGMFLGKNRKRFDGVAYEYWTLCETARPERGRRQRVVASLGKLTDEEIEGGWEDLEALLDGRRPGPFW